MKKNGFTLSEMLGVVIIMGVLALLIVPTIEKSIKENKQSLYDTQIGNIITAAGMWATDNYKDLPLVEEDFIFVYLRDLKQGGYIDDDISDPRNGKLFPDDTIVLVTRRENDYVYEVLDGNNFDAGIVLSPNGTDGYDKAVYVKVLAIPNAGNTINSVTYKVNGGESQSLVNNRIALDTNGTYTLEITSVDSGGNTKVLTSNPYYIDVTPPTITFEEGDAGLHIVTDDATSYDLKTGVIVSDNNSISLDNVTVSGSLNMSEGEYVITYTVTDVAGNTATKTRKVTVSYACDTLILGRNITSGEVVCKDPGLNPRYVGLNPNNYVLFNNELWRIIGKFDGQVKLIRDRNYTDSSVVWDTSQKNDWSQASLRKQLNSNFLESMDETSKSYIDMDHVWNIGGTSSTYRKDSYIAERGNSVYDGHSSLWVGAVGLMYPSDYGYSTSSTDSVCDNDPMSVWYEVIYGNYENDITTTPCYENSWLRSAGWTMTPSVDYFDDVYYAAGYVTSNFTDKSYSARPVVYLNSNVMIASGSGTSEDPYTLEINPIKSDIISKSDPSDLATNDPDGNLRYVGVAPDNYVYFNKNAEGNPEKWRIIGVFHDDEKGDQIKIIRDLPYNDTTIIWDAEYNNWAEADLQEELNGTYLTSIHTNDPTSYGYIDLEHVWNIGGTPNYNSSTRSDFYNAERSNTISSSMTSSTWTGAIGLMYPSDYGYASSGTSCDTVKMYNWENYSDCYSNSWLYDNSNYQWTLTPRSDDSNRVFLVYGNGCVRNISVSSNYVARPVLFLKSDVGIASGTGTYDDPFVLSM